MRNVTIWSTRQPFHRFMRLYEYKGHTGTLNEFVSPFFVYRDSAFRPRGDRIGPTTSHDIKKGHAVLMCYQDGKAVERGDGFPHRMFSSMNEAICWLIENHYEFQADESHRYRRCTVKVIDWTVRRQEYTDIAAWFRETHPKLKRWPQNETVTSPAQEDNFPRVRQTIVGISPTDIHDVTTLAGESTLPRPPDNRVIFDSSIPVPPAKVMPVGPTPPLSGLVCGGDDALTRQNRVPLLTRLKRFFFG